MKKNYIFLLSFVCMLAVLCALSCLKQQDSDTSSDTTTGMALNTDASSNPKEPQVLSDIIDSSICHPAGTIFSLGKHFYIYDCSNKNGIKHLTECNISQNGEADVYASIVAGKGNYLFKDCQSPNDQIAPPITMYYYSPDMSTNTTITCKSFEK